MGERVHKIIARNGIASRREAETWIAEGKITINGRVATLGDQAEPRDRIEIEGKRVHANAIKTRVLLYHKPVDEICTHKDEEKRPTIFDKLPHLRGQKWVNVGRLDINTSGLLLMTNDGELANKLMHPKANIVREYNCRVRGKIDDDDIRRLLRGVRLQDGLAKFDRVTPGAGSGSNRWFKVELGRGRYREVRRLWQTINAQVSRLVRIRFGPFKLPKTLPAGSWIELDSGDIAMLRAWLEKSPDKSSDRTPDKPSDKKPASKATTRKISTGAKKKSSKKTFAKKKVVRKNISTKSPTNHKNTARGR